MCTGTESRKNQTLLIASTPGRTLSYSSSKLTPPPVLTWSTLSSVFHLAQQVAMLHHLCWQCSPWKWLSLHESFVPQAKASPSETPTGLFHILCPALVTASAFLLLSGAQSKPSQPADMPEATVAWPVLAFSSNLSAVTKVNRQGNLHTILVSLGHQVFTVLAPSASDRKVPISVLLSTLRKIKAILPPIIISLTLSSILLISWICLQL